jgi:long-chain acyl-CoA synthetase
MLLTRMQESASRYPDKIAVQIKTGDRYQQYTYRDLVRGVASIARSLSEHGISKGDRIALFSENRPEWMIAYLAVLANAAIIVPLDAQFTDKEVAILLASSEAKAVLVSDASRQKLPKNGSLIIISFDPGEGVPFHDMLMAHHDAAIPPAPSAGDLAAILYTSGTTGDPKGVMLSHGNLASNLESVIKLDLFDHTDNLLLILPLHHTYPAMACILLPFALGATVTILNSLKGPDILSCMRETGVSVMVGVPLLYSGLRKAIFDEISRKPAPVRMMASLFLRINGLLVRTTGTNIG